MKNLTYWSFGPLEIVVVRVWVRVVVVVVVPRGGFSETINIMKP